MHTQHRYANTLHSYGPLRGDLVAVQGLHCPGGVLLPVELHARRAAALEEHDGEEGAEGLEEDPQPQRREGRRQVHDVQVAAGRRGVGAGTHLPAWGASGRVSGTAGNRWDLEVLVGNCWSLPGFVGICQVLSGNVRIHRDSARLVGSCHELSECRNDLSEPQSKRGKNKLFVGKNQERHEQ